MSRVLWFIVWSVFALSTTGLCASYTIVTDTEAKENTTAFFAAELSVTNEQALQQICDVGLAQYLIRRTEIDAQRQQAAFKAADPADQAAICAVLLSYGYTCPPPP